MPGIDTLMLDSLGAETVDALDAAGPARARRC